MLTEDEYAAFIASGGNPDFLKKFIKLEKGEVIEDWEKASTVYSATGDAEVQNGKFFNVFSYVWLYKFGIDGGISFSIIARKPESIGSE